MTLQFNLKNRPMNVYPQMGIFSQCVVGWGLFSKSCTIVHCAMQCPATLCRIDLSLVKKWSFGMKGGNTKKK